MNEIKRIRILMDEKKITTTRLSKLINEPQGKVANWLIRGGVPKKHLKNVANVFGVSVDYLID